MKHTERLRVNWIDTDASGRIHYTAALRYFEVAEHGLMRQLFDGSGQAGARHFGLPRVHVESDYPAMLTYPEEFDCSARVAAVGNSSVTFAFEAQRASDAVVCLTGRIVAVAVDAEGQSMPLPDDFRSVLTNACEGESG